jgi:hypothetical protein
MAHDPADLAVIEAHINQLGVAALADQIRAQNGQLAVPDQTCHATDYRALEPTPQRPGRPGTVTVHPVPIADLERASHWHLTYSQWAGIVTGIVAAAGFIWAIVWLMTAIVSAADATIQAASSAAPSIGGIAVIALLALWLMCRGGGGGKRISGTFEGRIHND